jgi:glycosyltransferase involved in cell wall biosynthesis
MSSSASRRTQIPQEPPLEGPAHPVFLFDSNGMNPYGFAVAKALDDSGVSIRYARRNANVVRLLGVGFGPPQGAASARLTRIARAVRLSGSLMRMCFRIRTAPIAHFLWESPADALLALAARFVLRKRVVVTIHDPTRAGALARSVRWALVRSGDRVVMHSEALASVLLAEDSILRRNKLLVVPLPGFASLVRGRSVAEARRELGFGDRDELILFFGQLRADKGLSTLTTACRSLLYERPELSVVIAGVSTSSDVETDLRVGLGGSDARVRLLVGPTPVEEDTLLSLIEAADLVVLPLDRASQSSSSVLALSHGRALVTTAAGENAALARAGAAAIVPVGDPVALAATCARLLDSPMARSELSERGAVYARDVLDPAIHARALMTMYDGLATEGR